MTAPSSIDSDPTVILHEQLNVSDNRLNLGNYVSPTRPASVASLLVDRSGFGQRRRANASLAEGSAAAVLACVGAQVVQSQPPLTAAARCRVTEADQGAPSAR